jgi:hypothetical protein
MTLTEQRTTLVDMLDAAGVRAYGDPGEPFTAPCIRLNAGTPWIAPSVLRSGGRTVRWELWAVAGRSDSKASFADLEVMVGATTLALDALPGYSAISWDRPALVEMGGVTYLASRGQIETIGGV